MGETAGSHYRLKNHLLLALPEIEYVRLVPYIQRIPLEPGEVLQVPYSPVRRVYFLDDGVASMSVSNSDGEKLEVSTVGKESWIGDRVIFKGGYHIIHCEMLTSGTAHWLPSDIFLEEFNRRGTLHNLVVSHMQSRMMETCQIALCNQTHVLEKRLARWLLTLSDRSSRDQFVMTHEQMSQILAVNRPSVSLAAKKLQKSGLIDYKRSTLTIVDRTALAEASCECHEIIARIAETYAAPHRTLRPVGHEAEWERRRQSIKL